MNMGRDISPLFYFPKVQFGWYHGFNRPSIRGAVFSFSSLASLKESIYFFHG